MVKDDDLKYTVGYRKPPRHAQFNPGQSGNAKGRPKKATAVDDVLYEEFNRFVTITEGRKRQLRLCGSEWLVIGAKDEGSERYIRGLTVGVALCDEVSLMPLRFISMTLRRR